MTGAPHNVWDDLKQAGKDALVDPMKVPGDLALAAYDAMHASAYGAPGSTAAFHGAIKAMTAGSTVGDVAGAAFAANFIGNTFSSSPDQSAAIAQADAAVAQAESQIANGSADAGTLGALSGSYGGLHGFNNEVWAAQGRVGAKMDQVNMKMALRDAAARTGGSAGEANSFPDVQAYLEFKKQQAKAEGKTAEA